MVNNREQETCLLVPYPIHYMNFYQLRELGASGKEDIITSCLLSEPNALNVVFLIDVFSNLCSYLVWYIHNSLIYVGNCKSGRFVSGRVSFYFLS